MQTCTYLLLNKHIWCDVSYLSISKFTLASCFCILRSILNSWRKLISRNAHHVTLTFYIKKCSSYNNDILLHYCCICYSSITYQLDHISLKYLHKIIINIYYSNTNICYLYTYYFFAIYLIHKHVTYTDIIY